MSIKILTMLEFYCGNFFLLSSLSLSLSLSLHLSCEINVLLNLFSIQNRGKKSGRERGKTKLMCEREMPEEFMNLTFGSFITDSDKHSFRSLSLSLIHFCLFTL